MQALNLLNSWTAPPFLGMTYARYQPRMPGLDTDPHIIAIGATCNQTPAGLALAQTGPDGNSSNVLSIFVLPSYRGRGLGTALLASLEEQTKLRGSRRLAMTYARGKATTAALERIISKLNWVAPQPRMMLCTADARLLQAKWMRPRLLPPSFELFRWRDLKTRERETMLEEQQEQPFYSPSVSPFQEEEAFYPESSIGLRREDKIAGWMITHRIGPRTVRYTSLFVRREFRHLSLSLVLLTEAIRRQAADLGYDSFGLFGVSAENRSMMAFVKRHVAPFLISLRETYGTYKVLDGGAGDPANTSVE